MKNILPDGILIPVKTDVKTAVKTIRKLREDCEKKNAEKTEK